MTCAHAPSSRHSRESGNPPSVCALCRAGRESENLDSRFSGNDELLNDERVGDHA